MHVRCTYILHASLFIVGRVSEKAPPVSTLIIIPAYNEEKSIVSTIEELRAELPSYDYIIVNDGSQDGTSRVCHEHHYNVIDLPINLGLAGAFQVGMKFAYRNGYSRALQFDADGQHVPSYIPFMVSHMDTSKDDIVIGSRFLNEKKPHSMRMMGSNLISKLIKLVTGSIINDPTSGMRLYNRKMIELFATRNDMTPEPDTLAFLIKYKNALISEEQVVMRERAAGESYLTPTKAISYMIASCSSILFSLWFRR